MIRGAFLYRTGAGTNLRDDDIVETDAGQAAQLEDGAGTLIALGPRTRVLLRTTSAQQPAAAGPVRIAMLNGWLKAGSAVGVARQFPLSLEFRGLTIEPAGGRAWSVVAMVTDHRAGLFAETGDDAIAARAPAPQPERTLRAGQYLELNADELPRVQPRPSVEFVRGMPPVFRDPLVGQAGRLQSRHELPAPLRAVDFADVSDWLTSSVSERETFVRRFAPRLGSASFRAEVDAHSSDLPEWRPVLHPPPRASTVARKRRAQASPEAGSGSGVDTEYQNETTSGDVDAH
ncbi:hypothetical protein [Paraburkholderia antibiotica]|uniref:Uncharacterized protein n=1 Tax=Paraburkholderia antibiotica TaxID=2728839 RepID=A0A7X9ZWX5_9BURK|nr:hypothetical protein [Paraburkholderia antibiotica]NML29768.1 hypothetical protein [Paraburkholderia antibiotica]